MNDLKIEAGKWYKLRNGIKAFVYRTDAKGCYPIKGWSDGGDGFHNNLELAHNGCVRLNGLQSELDIIAAWTEPHPAESWPVDAKILVRDSSHEDSVWVRAHFACFKYGVVNSFKQGLTSHTSYSINDTDRWNFAKLFEEDQS